MNRRLVAFAAAFLALSVFTSAPLAQNAAPTPQAAPKAAQKPSGPRRSTISPACG